MNYYYILGLIGATITGFLIHKFGPKTLKKFKNSAKTLKKYWYFVLAFIVVSTTVYWSLLSLYEDPRLSLYVSIANTALGLVFAIFVGYFAFIQVLELRVDRILQEAEQNLIQGVAYWPTAIRKYKEALFIRKDSFRVAVNLTELCLLTNNEIEFEEYLGVSEKIAKEADEKLTIHILKACNAFLNQRITSGTKEIDEIIKLIKNTPKLFQSFYWGFGELKSSVGYDNLGVCEAKKYIDNLAKYLQRHLDDFERNNFEEGDYLLTTIQEAPPESSL